MGEKITNPLPVYSKIYNKLKQEGKEEMHLRDYRNFILSLKVCNGDDIEDIICNKLLSLGLTKRQAELIRRRIAWRLNFSLRDAREILKGMQSHGMVSVSKDKIVLK